MNKNMSVRNNEAVSEHRCTVHSWLGMKNQKAMHDVGGKV